MKFYYIKLGDNTYKVFVKNLRGYGEFYIDFYPENNVIGEGEIKWKDLGYADFLIKEFEAEMKGYWNEMEELDREVEELDIPAYIRKGVKLNDEDIHDWAEMHGARQNEDGEWEV